MTVSNSIVQRALRSGNPVIDGSEVTFIWEGATAPQLRGDMNLWSENPERMKRVSSRLTPDSTKPLWYITFDIPRDEYIEYLFYDPATQVHFPDPLNKRSVNNGLGGRNSFFYMPETMPSPFPMRRADVIPGTLSKHNVETGMLDEFGTRDVYLYKPPVSETVPLLVVYDGVDYMQLGKLAVIVNSLMADKRIRPIAMALMQNGKRRREVEYACSDATLNWLDQYVLPLAHKHIKLLDIKKHPGAYGVLGISLGASMSMYTGLRMPEIFGKVLSQGAVFEIGGRDLAVVDLVRHRQAQHIDLWMDVGRLDSLLEDNRRMKGMLTENGYHFQYRECQGGHNYTSWRDDVWRGLQHLFPPV